jgi:hypothetical protein
MEGGIVLDIYLLPQANGVHIAPYHRIIPEAAARARFYIAYQGGIFSYKTIVA